ncbi:hypothetical protein MY10362_004821 [Beauveria mimosiformis]
MTRVLLTGGSGFIATHILKLLLERGHSVVTTVRNSTKAEDIKKNYPNMGSDRLDFAIVPDIAKASAFDQVIESDPPFEAVIHTASPFTFNVTDIKRDLLDPAINGTTGILYAIKKKAPQVKRVVITSSFGSMTDMSKGLWPGHTYSEKDWNPITAEQALENPDVGYPASKTFAEKAAWDFITDEKPGFTLATILPPFVFGPAVQSLSSLKELNTSNQFIFSFAAGAAKDGIPPTKNPLFVDVRDVAFAHVKAIETAEAGGKRFFVAGGYCSNREIIDVIRTNFPAYKDTLPAPSVSGGELPLEVYKFDVSRSVDILDIKYRSLQECVKDTAYGGSEGPAPFHRAILQSPAALPAYPESVKERTFVEFLQLLNVSSLAEARQVPSEALIQANAEYIARQPTGVLPFLPSHDGSFLPDEPATLLAQGRFDQSVDIVVGSNTNDGLYFGDFAVTSDDEFLAWLARVYPSIRPEDVETLTTSLYPPVFDGSQGYVDQAGRTGRFAQDFLFQCNGLALAWAKMNQTFNYEFAVSPALHALDIAYTFYNDDPSTVVAPQAAKTLQQYFTSFAINGTPSSPGSPSIPFNGPSGQILVLDATESHTAADTNLQQRRCAERSRILTNLAV